MELRAPISGVGCSKVDLARGCSLLTSRQVEYVVECFDLTESERMFAFVFQLYNLISLAKGDNDTLNDLNSKLSKLQSDIKLQNLPGLSTINRKRKTRDNDDGGDGGDGSLGPVGNDILSDAAILGALERAGYTFPTKDEILTPILRVCVSFLCTGQRLTLPLS